MKQALFEIDAGKVANRIKKYQKLGHMDGFCRYVIYVAKNRFDEARITTFVIQLRILAKYCNKRNKTVK